MPSVQPKPPAAEPVPGRRRTRVHPGLLLAAAALMVASALLGGSGPLRAGWAWAAVLLVFLVTFGALALNLVDRLSAVTAGAVALLLLGSLLGSYTPLTAASYLGGKLDTLVLLGSLDLVTGLLGVSGLFERVARRIVLVSRGSRRVVMVLLCVATYALSCFVNNLAAMLVIIPISLLIAETLEMDARTLIVAEIVACNLGGASTMVGDFPNLLIATDAGLPFHEFILHLMPVCLLELGVLILFVMPAFPGHTAASPRVSALVERLQQAEWDPRLARRGLVVFAAMMAGFLLGGEIGLSPALIGALGAVAALTLAGLDPRALLGRMHLGDLAFFAALFLMVGAVEASGVLGAGARALSATWQRAPTLGLVVTACAAALLTTVLNAGPTTAVLIHVVFAAFRGDVVPEAIWWALSLGVCAGSSATLTGATAGPVAASWLERRGHELTFAQFAGIGVPLMAAFLGISCAYLAFVAR